MTDKPKEVEIVSDGRDMFAVVDGVPSAVVRAHRKPAPESRWWQDGPLPAAALRTMRF